MTEYHNNILCIESNWLVRSGVISKNNYRVLTQRGNLQVLRRGCRNTPALVEYDSIPERFRKLVVQKIGDPKEQTKHIKFRDFLRQDAEAINYFNDYTVPDGLPLPEKNKKEYAANAAVFNAINFLLNNKLSKRKALGNAKVNVWGKIADVVQSLPYHQWPCNLPKNARRLKDKYKAFQEEGYISLIHAGFCNDNSEKINDTAKSWLIARYADPVNRVATTWQLWVEYNKKAKQEDWKLIKSDKTIYNYLHQEEIKPLWFASRYGELKAKEKFTYFHSTKLPTMRDSLWYSDGTKLNLYYLDENGKMTTAIVYEVMDAYSEVFLGYHIGQSEDYIAQYHAYKMAAKTAGHRPYQLGFDNQGGHGKLKSGEFLNKLAHLPINTQPYNGKSKTIENAFGRFQQQYMKKLWYFTGQNVTTKKAESKANMEYILANKESLPSFNEAIEAYIKVRNEWNNDPFQRTGEPRMQKYLNSSNPESPELSALDMVDLFWILREKPVMYAPSGLSFKEKKIKYEYVVFDENREVDMNFHVHSIDKKFRIKFDPEDMTMIYLYEDTPLGLRFVNAAETKPVISRGRQEITEFEDIFAKRMNAKNKETRVDMRDATERVLDDHDATPEHYGHNSPHLKGIESKKSRKSKKTDEKPKRKVQPVSIGEYEKEVSNADIYDLY